ncbi:hypothetical protein BS78_09G082700 [Paspalum vaginatum]|nr:hypothetical protein BS78_09G082700 [Paspalum vaginatum]
MILLYFTYVLMQLPSGMPLLLGDAREFCGFKACDAVVSLLPAWRASCNPRILISNEETCCSAAQLKKHPVASVQKKTQDS